MSIKNQVSSDTTQKQKNSAPTSFKASKIRNASQTVGSFGGAFKTNEGGSKELERPSKG